MFWIKKTNFKQKNGYLYLRETTYERDKRTLKKKAKKFGDGTANKYRSKYSKKKDIYCGKIYELELKDIQTFNDFISNKYPNKEFLEYKLNSNFNIILADFIDYLLAIYKIDKDEFYSLKKKKVYFVANAYLCIQTIDWIKRFHIRGNAYNPEEIERFSIRCQDSGIYDKEIVATLYSKIIPEDQILQDKDIEEDVKEIKFKTVKDFIKQQHSQM